MIDQDTPLTSLQKREPSVRAPKVRSCSEFASDLRDVAALKTRARKFVL